MASVTNCVGTTAWGRWWLRRYASQRHGVPALAGAGFIWLAQLLPEIALDLSGASFAVFVDAACDGGAPGSVHLSQLANEIAPNNRVGQVAGALGCWVDLSPTALLSLSAELFGAAPPAVLVTVTRGCADDRGGLVPCRLGRRPGRSWCGARELSLLGRTAMSP